MLVLIAVAAALVLAGGYGMFRHHRAGADDDLVVQ
jgi:hypothetical protein